MSLTFSTVRSSRRLGRVIWILQVVLHRPRVVSNRSGSWPSGYPSPRARRLSSTRGRQMMRRRQSQNRRHQNQNQPEVDALLQVRPNRLLHPLRHHHRGRRRPVAKEGRTLSVLPLQSQAPLVSMPDWARSLRARETSLQVLRVRWRRRDVSLGRRAQAGTRTSRGQVMNAQGPCRWHRRPNQPERRRCQKRTKPWTTR